MAVSRDPTGGEDIPTGISRVYSADGGQGGYEISGQLLLELCYHDEEQKLNVHVDEAKNLAEPKEEGICDSYVKIYLLPDCSTASKRKTSIQRKTTNPKYDANFEYKVPKKELCQRTLWISVWDWDEFGRNFFLGEFHIPLHQINLTNSTKRWFQLEERRQKSKNDTAGHIHFSINYSEMEHGGKLSIRVLYAVLESVIVGPINMFVRALLLPVRSCEAEQRTKYINDFFQPCWSETIEYDGVAIEELATSLVLELSVWNYDGIGNNEFVGCIRLGQHCNRKMDFAWMDSNKAEAHFWTEMIRNPETPINVFLPLRSTIAGRFPDMLQDSSEYLGLFSDTSETGKSESTGTSEVNIEGNYYTVGRILTRLTYYSRKLTIQLLKAEELAEPDRRGYSNPYVKICLMQSERKICKWISRVVEKELNPIFYQRFKYEIDSSQLSSCTVHFTVLHHNHTRRDNFLGRAEVQLADPLVYGHFKWLDLNE